MNDKQKFIKNLFATLIITVIWCFIWMTLEILIDGYTIIHFLKRLLVKVVFFYLTAKFFL